MALFDYSPRYSVQKDTHLLFGFYCKITLCDRQAYSLLLKTTVYQKEVTVGSEFSAVPV